MDGGGDGGIGGGGDSVGGVGGGGDSMGDDVGDGGKRRKRLSEWWR